MLYHRSRARHIAVLCGGHWYRVDVVRVPSGIPVEAYELERQFIAIQSDSNRLNQNLSAGIGINNSSNNSSSKDGESSGTLNQVHNGSGSKNNTGSSGENSSSNTAKNRHLRNVKKMTFGMRRSRSTPMGMGEAMKNDQNVHGGMYEQMSCRQISALTTLPRDEWAKAKEEHFSDGTYTLHI